MQHVGAVPKQALIKKWKIKIIIKYKLNLNVYYNQNWKNNIKVCVNCMHIVNN